MTKTIFITIDCFRKNILVDDQLRKKLIPFMNKLKKESYYFTNFISNGSTTAPAFFALFTSNVPVLDGNYSPIPPDKITFPKKLQNENIKTCGIHSNPYLDEFCNYNLGFDDFFDTYRNPNDLSFNSIKTKLISKLAKITRSLRIKRYISKIKSLGEKFNIIDLDKSSSEDLLKKPYDDAKQIVRKSIGWLEENHRDDFFLWMHFMDAHVPYFPPFENLNEISNENIKSSSILKSKKIIRFLREGLITTEEVKAKYQKLIKTLYRAEIHYIDHILGIFFKYLKKKKLYNQINLVLTADHGEALFEHNLIGHNASLYEELINIPLIIKPSNLEKNKFSNINILCQSIDLAPTILDLYHLSEPKFKGKSLIHALKEEKNFKEPKYVISAVLHNNYRVYNAYSDHDKRYYLLISCRTKNWKLIYDEKKDRTYLYRLDKDKNEVNDLSQNNKNKEIKQVKSMLWNILKPYVKDYEGTLKIKNIIKSTIGNSI